jgi:hypothetical protein
MDNVTYLGNEKFADKASALPVYSTSKTTKDTTPILKADESEAIAQIEQAINSLIIAKEQGRTLVFDANGYGKLSTDPQVSQESLVYLSQRLFDEFGYINPVLENNPQFMNYVYASQPLNIEEDITTEISVQQVGEIRPENISSKGSDFAKKLTNPGNNLQVEYKGKVFRNAEHAYQTWKSGEFDQKAYDSKAFKPVGSKPANKNTNYQTMVDILIAKLQQHPELLQGINERGGLAYIEQSTHNVTGDKFWESSGQNKFIEALSDAYNVQTSQIKSDDNLENPECGLTGIM